MPCRVAFLIRGCSARRAAGRCRLAASGERHANCDRERGQFDAEAGFLDCYPPPPNSCSWVRDAVVFPITVVLLSCVGGRAFMIAPNRDNGNGFRASDCKIAEYNIFFTLLFFTLLFFVDCFAGNTRKCRFQCISARICVQNGISAPVILFFVVFWDSCARCLA